MTLHRARKEYGICIIQLPWLSDYFIILYYLFCSNTKAYFLQLHVQAACDILAMNMNPI